MKLRRATAVRAAGIRNVTGRAAAGPGLSEGEGRRVHAWIGLGGNQENSAALVLEAIERLGELPQTSIRRRSSLYRSAPWGLAGQADFVNAVAELDTVLGPHDLLESLMAIETGLGRRRDGERWGPRCIDLDLLTYEDVVLESECLVLPHPRMHRRAFVLMPLMELEPKFRIPGVGAAAEALESLCRDEINSVTIIEPTQQEHSK